MMSTATSERPAFTLQDFYLTLFVLFHQLGPRDTSGKHDPFKGVIGVSLIQWFFGLTLFMWVQIGFEYRVPLEVWIAPAIGIPLCILNGYFLMTKGKGTAFEKRFNKFSKKKRITLRSMAIAASVATMIAFYFSITAYHAAFNIHPPT